MTPKNLPWVLWELSRGAQRPWWYGVRVLVAFFAVLVVGHFAQIARPGMQFLLRGFTPYLALAYLAAVGGAIMFFRWSSRSFTARSLTSERRDGTLALLLCTPRHPFEIVISKTLPGCGLNLGATLGCIPILLIASMLQLWPLGRMLAVWCWLCSLVVLWEAARVAVTCTTLSEKSAQAAVSIAIAIFVLAPLALQALCASYSWARYFGYLNPMLGILGGRAGRFFIAAALNLGWSLLWLWLGTWWLTREVYPSQGRVGMFWHRLARRIKRLIPWQPRVERWLLERYPIAWLNLRSFAWVLFPSAVLIGIVFAAIALWHFPGEDTAGGVLGYAGFLAFAFVIGVRTSVDRTLKVERESRMDEVIQPLPIQATRVVSNRLIESAFWIGPSLVLLGVTASVVAGLFLRWEIAVTAFLGLIETLALSAVICLGTHTGARIRKAFWEPDQWLLVIIAVAIVAVIPGSMVVTVMAEAKFGAWFICSLARIGMDLFLARFLFGWLVRKIEKGESNTTAKSNPG